MKKGLKDIGFDPSNLDTSVRPQDDFAHFATNGWLKKNPLPETEAQWGTFYVLREGGKEKLRKIALRTVTQKNVASGSHLQLVRDFWLSGMNEKVREDLDIQPLKQVFAKIDAIQNVEDLTSFTAYAHREGFDVLWASSVGPDDKHSDQNAFHLVQSGISLPDRDYYLKTDAESKRIRMAYEIYVKDLLELSGFTKERAERSVKTILAIETKLAKASITRVEWRDIEKLYNKWTLKTLIAKAPNVDWNQYLKLLGVKTLKDLVVYQPKFMQVVSELLPKISVPDWKAYFYWKVLDESASLLSSKFVKRHFAFYGTTLTGVKEMKPLWKKVVGTIDGSIGNALGKLYVEEYFKSQAKKKINEMVNNLFVAYKDRLKKLDWMEPSTKKKALIKLAKIQRKLGHPDTWEKYPGLRIEPDDYFGNISRTHLFWHRKMLKKIGKKPNRREWHMSPPTVNAYYSANMNEIVFPAGIMQSPFFDPNADDALNYGGIGSVIGHEITHGFDDEGRKFDEKGNLHNWWSKKDKDRFVKKSNLLVKHFNNFVAIDNLHVNGKLTLGENIADLGGLVMAYAAFEKSQKGKKRETIGGFTPEQRFFLGYAITEATHVRPEELKRRLIVDPHSPKPFRVNGPLSSMEEFYKAFDVQKGDKLYRDPSDRAKIW